MAKPRKSTPIGWRVQLSTGLALALMALAAVRVDVLNNWEYGKTVSLELATILVLAAVGVVALPTAAAILGWSRHIKLTVFVCVLLTVWSAVNAYSTKQGRAILQAQSSQQAYEAALADEKAARGTLARIAETGDAEELSKLQSSIEATKATACRHPKSEACKLAETDERTITARLSDAKARDKAQAFLAQAKGEAKAGPVEASMVATVIARETGADAASVARTIALALTGLGIAVTQLVALLGGHAASLIGGALKARPTKREARRPGSKKSGAKAAKTRLGNVLSFPADKQAAN
jgi:cation transport regulator ChaC